MAKKFKWKVVSRRKCARGSMRTLSPNKSTRLRICCPSGSWMPRKKRCSSSTFLKEKGKRI